MGRGRHRAIPAHSFRVWPKTAAADPLTRCLQVGLRRADAGERERGRRAPSIVVLSTSPSPAREGAGRRAIERLRFSR
jgi:hypothetical protein